MKLGQIQGIAIAVIFLVVIGVGVYVIFFVNKPISDEANSYTNISITTVNDAGDLVGTGYKIYIDGILYKEGNTTRYGSTLERVYYNKTIKIVNNNIKDQEFYTEVKTKALDVNQNITAFKFNLEEPDNLEVLQTGVMGQDQTIRLQLSSKNFKNVFMCIETTSHFWAVVVNPRAEKVNKPERYIDFDDCYYLNKSISEGNNLVVELTPKFWGVPTEEDYIEVLFIDGNEITDGSIERISMGETVDLGATDFIHIINYEY